MADGVSNIIGGAARAARVPVDDFAQSILTKHTRNGVLDVDAAAAEISELAQSDPGAAADALEIIGQRLDPQDRQRLTDAVGDRITGGGADAAAKRELLLDLGQIALDIAGLVDPTPVSDGLNGLISLFRGDFVGAGVSALSMIPYVGDLAKAGKLGKWAETITNAAELAVRNSDFARTAGPALKKIADALDAMPMNAFNALPSSVQQQLLSMRSSLDNALSRIGMGASAEPGTLAHKAHRWQEYQAQGGQWNYDRWSTTYENNMVRAREAHAATNSYHSTLGWGRREVTVQVNIDVNGQTQTVARRLDIADTAARRGVEHKTGYQTLDEANRYEIQRDAALVARGWDIEWVFQGGQQPSAPLLQALTDAGITYKIL